MDRKTFIAICQVTDLDSNGHAEKPVMGMRVFDTFGNGTGMVHLLPEHRHDDLLYGDTENLVEIAHEVAPVVMELAKDLTVLGKSFDIEEWRASQSAGFAR